MTKQTNYEPFAMIIHRGLAERSVKGALDRHPEHNTPCYLVRMCEELTCAIRDAGNQGVTLAEIVRLERTCTGTDYLHKLALRCYRLAHRAAA
ncbi:TPA: hypothetical protein ACPH4X_003792 [Pseudomonas aeruginosa]|uniref:hypothetical protein n=1 Tax=Pseudomonas aeruginosa TaxID=287 RepID=UPI0003B95541|nr:hypothetical protein [Pseudomonas aeruginosa]ERX93959.1 hypothetical protein Q077_06490 [Pseudomonas aeruginosa BL23]MDY1121733.1 hypothetical protein [Pseudomonas aeruginosa]OTI18639.1 hypothetical protein CAY89_21910 [Pseudomonas aeruginosa]OTI37215.1 hypothetical protein CAY97_20840 [Pseudomonas aeruginosa]OTI43370.1 hypothetical protein CAZ18_21130 [Pseudomonas aeruginosa]